MSTSPGPNTGLQQSKPRQLTSPPSHIFQTSAMLPRVFGDLGQLLPHPPPLLQMHICVVHSGRGDLTVKVRGHQDARRPSLDAADAAIGREALVPAPAVRERLPGSLMDHAAPDVACAPARLPHHKVVHNECELPETPSHRKILLLSPYVGSDALQPHRVSKRRCMHKLLVASFPFKGKPPAPNRSCIHVPSPTDRISVG